MLLGGIGLAFLVLSANDPAVTARFSFELAAAEVAVCCADRVADAPLSSQRRWAYALYAWLVETDAQPNWTALRDPDLVERQMALLEPEYVAVLAVHDENWLNRYASDLPKAAPRNVGASKVWFTQALWTMAALELDLVAAADQRDREVRLAEATYASVATEVKTAKRQARVAAREALLAGRPFVADTAFAIKRASLDASVAELKREIRRLQEEFWTYEAEWKERNGAARAGSPEQTAQLIEYRAIAEKYSKQVKSITDNVVEMSRRRDMMSFAEVRRRLAAIERPSVVRPVGLPPVTSQEGHP